jgi:hypothetical protein
MAELRLIHTADAIQAIYQRIDAAARLLPVEDPRTRDQQRADLTIDAILAGIPDDALPELQGRRPSIQVVVSADTLLGLDDESAELTGYGPITAQHARELAAAGDATWRRLLTDPDTGQLLDYGRTTYRPPRDLTDFVLARDPVCFFPHCHQPGYLCDLDHTTPWNQGGETCPANNRPGCRRHHNCKTRSIFSYRITDDGAYTWTSDTGHTYTSHSPQYATRRGERPGRTEKAEHAKPESEHDWRQREDHDYAQLERWLQAEIQREHEAGRTGHAQAAQRALTDAQHQRHHQLKTRDDPDHIPF